MDDQVTRLLKTVMALTREFKTVGEAAAAEGPRGLRPVEAETILFVGGRPCSSAGELAAHLKMPSTTAASIIERLCRKGLMSKRRDARDGRVTRLAVTAAGEAARTLLIARHRRDCERLLAPLDPDEADALITLLEKACREIAGPGL